MKNKNRFFAAPCWLLCLVAWCAPLLPANAAEAAEATASTAPRLRLAAESSRWVAHDRVLINLGAQARGAQQADVAQQLNRAVNAVLARAADNKALQARSGPYSVWPQTHADKDSTEAHESWRGHAQVMIESADFDAASRFAASVQAHMAIEHLHFALSEQARANLQAQLLDEAVAAFRARARQASAAFGFGGYRIGHVALGDDDRGSALLARGNMLEAASASAPGLQGGEEKVTLRVSGEIFLHNDTGDSAPVLRPAASTEGE